VLDFLGIGAQKAGTTWLYERLSQHPAVRFPAGKEIHFWDMFMARGLPWYQNLFADHTAGLVQGEITPAYAILPPTTIRQIAGQFPALRLFYLIRNPVDRAWSAALMALGRAELRLEEASDQWFIDHFRSQSSRQRGDYARCLRHWLACYPSEQLLVLRYDQIRQNPRLLLHRVCEHLGIDADFYATLPDASLQRKVFAGPGHPLRPSLRPVLEDLYAAPLAELRSLLNEPLHW